MQRMYRGSCNVDGAGYLNGRTLKSSVEINRGCTHVRPIAWRQRIPVLGHQNLGEVRRESRDVGAVGDLYSHFRFIYRSRRWGRAGCRRGRRGSTRSGR